MLYIIHFRNKYTIWTHIIDKIAYMKFLHTLALNQYN